MNNNPWPDLMAYYGNTPTGPRPNRHQRRRAAAVNRRFGVTVETKKDDE